MKLRSTVIPAAAALALLVAALFVFIAPEYRAVAVARIASLNDFRIEGVDGWRFFRGELDYVLLPWGNKAEKLSVIDRFAKAKGVRLVIIPVPEKIDLYPERLDRRLKNPAFQRTRYRRLMNELRKRQISVVDVYDTLLCLKDRSAPFLARETHVASSALKLIADKAAAQSSAFHDSLAIACTGQKRIYFTGSLEDEAVDGIVPHGDSLTIFYDRCADETAAEDTALIIGDSYTAYLAEFQGSFPDLLHASTGCYIKRISTIQPGFKLIPKIIANIERSPKHTTIYWIFSAREFCKPLRRPVVPE